MKKTGSAIDQHSIVHCGSENTKNLRNWKTILSIIAERSWEFLK